MSLIILILIIAFPFPICADQVTPPLYLRSRCRTTRRQRPKLTRYVRLDGDSVNSPKLV